MTELGITFLSLRLHPIAKDIVAFSPEEWKKKAEDIIQTVENKAKLPQTFGARRNVSELDDMFPQGYSYGNLFFEEFRIGYDPQNPEGGVFIGFSDVAMEVYLEKNRCTVYALLQNLQNESYTITIESMSIIAVLDEQNISLKDMCEGWRTGSLHIYCEASPRERRLVNCLNCPINYVVRDDYIALELVKDKLRLIIENDEAFDSAFDATLPLLSFTGSFHGDLAATLAEPLFSIDNDEAFTRFVANLFLDNFRLVHLEEGKAVNDEWFVGEMVECSYYGAGAIYPRVNDKGLEETILDIVRCGKLFSTLYKIQGIWGNEGLKDLWKCILETLSYYQPDEDDEYWIDRNIDYYKLTYPKVRDLALNLFVKASTDE